MIINYDNTRFELILDKRKQLRDGSYNIIVRVYHKGRYAYIRTGYTGTDKTMKNRQQSVESFFDRVAETGKRLIDSGTFTLESLKGAIHESKIVTLNALMRERQEKLSRERKASTQMHYKCACDRLTDCLGEIRICDVDKQKMIQFIDWMKEKKYSAATIDIYVSDVKSTINYAIYKGLMDSSKYPFKHSVYDYDSIKLPKSNKRSACYICKREMKELYFTFVKDPNIYLGMFLFSYLSGGTNIADLLYLTFDEHYYSSEGNELRFKRRKTEHKNDFYTVIPVNEYIRTIFDKLNIVPELNKRVFDILPYYDDHLELRRAEVGIINRVSAAANKAYKSIGGTKRITSTYARHSFATVMSREKVPAAYIEYAMAHSNNGVSSHYIAPFTTEELLQYSTMLF